MRGAIQLGALIGLLLSAEAWAQEEMRGLSEVSIIVGPIDEITAKCNITTESVEATIRDALEGSGLRVGDGDSDYLLIFGVRGGESAPTPGICAASMSLNLQPNSHGHTVTVNDYLRYRAVWYRASLVTGQKLDGFGMNVNALARAFTEQFLAEWSKQNPKPEPAPH